MYLFQQAIDSGASINITHLHSTMYLFQLSHTEIYTHIV